MSRTIRIAFIAILGLGLTVVAGLDLRLALASRDLADQTAAVLDQHERHPNGIGVVTYSNLDQHERRAASVQVAATTSGTVPAALDEHERRARAASR
jgi:hypothetical protein